MAAWTPHFQRGETNANVSNNFIAWTCTERIVVVGTGSSGGNGHLNCGDRTMYSHQMLEWRWTCYSITLSIMGGYREGQRDSCPLPCWKVGKLILSLIVFFRNSDAILISVLVVVVAPTFTSLLCMVCWFRNHWFVLDTSTLPVPVYNTGVFALYQITIPPFQNAQNTLILTLKFTNLSESMAADPKLAPVLTIISSAKCSVRDHGVDLHPKLVNEWALKAQRRLVDWLIEITTLVSLKMSHFGSYNSRQRCSNWYSWFVNAFCNAKDDRENGKTPSTSKSSSHFRRMDKAASSRDQTLGDPPGVYKNTCLKPPASATYYNTGYTVS